LSELPLDDRFAYDMKRALPDGRRRLGMTGAEAGLMLHHRR
jgi:hypothetical protein